MNSHAYWTCLCLCVFYCIKVSKGANIRNRYNQVPNVLFGVIGLCFVIVHFPLVFDCFIFYLLVNITCYSLSCLKAF